MTDTDLSDWLPIVHAAQIIRCSTRTIERLARAQKLEQRLRPQDGTPPVVVYNPDDVARIASERRPAPPPFVLPAGRAPVNRNGQGHGQSLKETPGSFLQTLPAGDDPIRQLFAAALRAVLSPPSPPVAERMAETLFLTIKEAAIMANLPAADIRRAIESGELKARKTGRGGWRIRRKDLEAL
ncbi:MAG: helix-turn-helix domain-containing protein [Acidobacteriota bacterium]